MMKSLPKIAHWSKYVLQICTQVFCSCASHSPNPAFSFQSWTLFLLDTALKPLKWPSGWSCFVGLCPKSALVFFYPRYLLCSLPQRILHYPILVEFFATTCCNGKWIRSLERICRLQHFESNIHVYYFDITMFYFHCSIDSSYWILCACQSLVHPRFRVSISYSCKWDVLENKNISHAMFKEFILHHALRSV